MTVYPAIMEDLIRHNNPEIAGLSHGTRIGNTYTEAVLTGGIGVGKCHIAILTQIYSLYTPRCLSDPQALFDLQALVDPSPCWSICSRCHSLFVICRRCDRVNAHCMRCAPIAGNEAKNGTAARYQESHQGKVRHATRQRRYRERLKERVTHKGSNDRQVSK